MIPFIRPNYAFYFMELFKHLESKILALDIMVYLGIVPRTCLKLFAH
jgi:hypothetical protein